MLAIFSVATSLFQHKIQHVNPHRLITRSAHGKQHFATLESNSWQVSFKCPATSCFRLWFQPAPPHHALANGLVVVGLHFGVGSS